MLLACVGGGFFPSSHRLISSSKNRCLDQRNRRFLIAHSLSCTPKLSPPTPVVLCSDLLLLFIFLALLGDDRRACPFLDLGAQMVPCRQHCMPSAVWQNHSRAAGTPVMSAIGSQHKTTGDETNIIIIILIIDY